MFKSLIEKINKKQSEFDSLKSDIKVQENIKNKKLKYTEKYANEELLLEIIDSYEDMGRVLKGSNDKESLLKGFGLIYSKLQKVLENE